MSKVNADVCSYLYLVSQKFRNNVNSDERVRFFVELNTAEQRLALGKYKAKS